jgi:predicted metal-dependent peptidase
MNKEAQQAVTIARTHLVLEHGFFGMLALRLRMSEDLSTKTLAVDGKTIFYNPDFVLKCSPGLRKATLAHEVMHCVFDHMGRLNQRSPRRWNQAADYAINQILEDSGFDFEGTGLLNAAYAGMSADQIYTMLPPEDPNDGNDPLDELMSGSTDPGATGVDWQIAATQAAQAAKAQGKLPGSLERFIDEMNKPQVNWRDQLRRFVTERSKNDYSWARPQRRFLAQGLILPGLHSESMGTMVAVSDDSGSVSSAILQALSTEIDAIAAATSPERLIHISCDAEINHVGEFSTGEPFKMVSKGGGGTDFNPPFVYLEENNIKPAALVYLTDGYGPFPATAPEYPVLWCMTTDVVPPWGECIRIEV